MYCLTRQCQQEALKFIPDPGIPSPFTAENSDYVRSGWSKGHMAPAGNNKFDQVRQTEIREGDWGTF